jgi:hypothetical protein
MLVISIPATFVPERSYVIDVLFGEFLGLDYRIEVEAETQTYRLMLDNGKTIELSDSFFSQFQDGIKYLDVAYIPTGINFARNGFTVEKDLPLLFGEPELTLSESGIKTAMDPIASAFFMLTRWEECVNPARDEHDRFPAIEALAVKHGFIDRPIVNEYAEMLRNMLDALGYSGKSKKTQFEFILTHDVDHLQRWPNFASWIKTLGADLIVRKNPITAIKNASRFMLHKDPFDTYNYLMDVSEQAGLKSYFFIHVGGISKYDSPKSESALKKVIDKINERNHVVGFHPSYDTYNDWEAWRREYELLSSLATQKVETGRQHYLRFDLPKTWEIWDSHGMMWDSTMCYAKRVGFRCGACQPFSVFNVHTRKKLRLKEYPLNVMDATLIGDENFTPEQIKKKTKKIIDIVKKYNGTFVLLWHNSSFCGDYENYQYIYEDILKYSCL